MDSAESTRRQALAIRADGAELERSGHLARREPRVLGADPHHQHGGEPDTRDISENSVTFGPDTMFVRLGATTGSRDTTFHGKTIQGLDQLDSERDPFSRAFNVATNDKGLPGDVVNALYVVIDTIPLDAIAR